MRIFVIVKQNTMNYTPNVMAEYPPPFTISAQRKPCLRQSGDCGSQPAMTRAVFEKQKDLSAAKDSIPMERHYEIEKHGKNITP